MIANTSLRGYNVYCHLTTPSLALSLNCHYCCAGIDKPLNLLLPGLASLIMSVCCCSQAKYDLVCFILKVTDLDSFLYATSFPYLPHGELMLHSSSIGLLHICCDLPEQGRSRTTTVWIQFNVTH